LLFFQLYQYTINSHGFVKGFLEKTCR
jgi:hypothetical protein